MTYLSDRQRRRGNIIQVIIWAVPIIIIFFFWLPIKVYLQPTAFWMASNVFMAKENFYNLGSHFKSYFTTRNTYLENIATLEKENDDLASEVVTLQEELSGNSTNIDSLSLHTKGVEVYPIFESFSKMYDNFLISKGFSDGVEKGMIVYTGGLKPIGTIDEVMSKTSRVSLLSSSGREIIGIIPETKTVLNLQGQGGGDFVTTLPKEITIQIGQKIFWKDNPAMELGEVAQIENEPQSVSQKVYVHGAYETTSYQRYYLDLK